MSKHEPMDAMLKNILAEQLKASGTFTPFIDKNTKANPFLEILLEHFLKKQSVSPPTQIRLVRIDDVDPAAL